MQQLISIITTYITPLLIVAVLVLLIVFLVKLIKAAESFDQAVIKTHKTMDLTNESLEKAQVTLDTAVNVAHTIDGIQTATVTAAKKVKTTVNDNLDDIVGVVGKTLGIKKKTNKTTKTKSQNVDDIIKGA